MPIPSFHPAISNWFNKYFNEPSPVQQAAWPAIAEGQHTLLAAPTGSGKTLAAFLACLNRLFEEGCQQTLADETRILYISPLKALSNDIQKNLQQPLNGIRTEFEALGLHAPQINAWVRTGDTPQSERQKAVKSPPHIVVTTPETAYLLLTSKSGRNMLKTVDTVIIDEIHALVSSKRGAHLALTLERLETLTPHTVTRIACSATQKPIDHIARFLTGRRDERCRLINTGHRRETDLAIEVPDSPLEAIMSNEVWEELYDKLAALVQSHTTTLIFVNTRRLTERAAKHLAERLGEEHVAAHHGSLAKEHRLAAEQRLKSGELRCLVATASLELGIDIGDIDLVCQLASPKSIATFLQRVGRSGHSVGKVPKGRLFPLSRDDLLECSALLHSVNEGELDQLTLCHEPLDVLSQQLIAEIASHDECSVDALYQQITRAWPFRTLSLTTLESVLDMLGNGFSTQKGRRSAYVHYDRINQRVRPRKGARLAALTNGGTIPDQFDYEVYLTPEDIKIGTLNEDFAFESMPGDIFQLGNTSYRILKIEQRIGKVIVMDAKGEPPNLPFWIGEAPGRSNELSQAVSRLRAVIDEALTTGNEKSLGHWLGHHCMLAPAASIQLIDYMSETKRALGNIPTQTHIIVERFFDDTGDMHYVIHSPFGSRINRAWGLALRKKFCRRFNFELQAAALEDSIILSLSVSHSFPITEPLSYVKSATAKDTLVQALLDAPIFPTYWRWVATTALAVRRNFNGKKSPAYFQRNDAEDLIALLFPDQIACAENITGQRQVPDHPLVSQAIADCLHTLMDYDGFENLLKSIEKQTIRVSGKDLHSPSPLAFEIISAKPYAFLDDAPAEERRALAIQTRQDKDALETINYNVIDQNAVSQVQTEAFPSIQSPDELHDALIVGGFILVKDTQDAQWRTFFDQLKTDKRAEELCLAQQGLWVAAERLHEFEQVYGSIITAEHVAITSSILKTKAPLTKEQALVEIIRSRLEIAGPLVIEELMTALALPGKDIELALVTLENEGFVVRGHFSEALPHNNQWCERRLLARIHRRSIKSARQHIKPVPPAQYMRFLFSWHHLTEKGQDLAAMSRTLSQLEGYNASALSWEQHLLPDRIHLYTRDMMDSLCQSGLISWLRLTRSKNKGDKHSTVVKNTAITLVCRESLTHWLAHQRNNDKVQTTSSIAQKVLHTMLEAGPSFFYEIVRQSGLLRTQVENALGELVSAGLVTSDNFEGLRALITPQKERQRYRPGHSRLQTASSFDRAGRWYVLQVDTDTPETQEADKSDKNGLMQGLETIALALLNRYGIVFPALLKREANAPPWRDLLRVYWRLEARGDIRGGRFVNSVSGEQFALPDALSALKSFAKPPAQNQYIVLSAIDPVNLTPVFWPDDKLPNKPATRVLFHNGLLAACQLDGRIIPMGPGTPPDELNMIRYFNASNPAAKIKPFRRRRF